jgi:SsrA-binding protein
MNKNRKAYFNYDIKDTVEAGVVLTGAEAKSVKDNRVDIKDAFVRQLGGELWLINANIARYKFSGDIKYDPTRSRKLLVKRHEMESLISKTKQGGLTLIPLKIYSKRGLVKVLVGIARGKKIHEKRLRQKERDLERSLDREKREYMVK